MNQRKKNKRISRIMKRKKILIWKILRTSDCLLKMRQGMKKTKKKTSKKSQETINSKEKRNKMAININSDKGKCLKHKNNRNTNRKETKPGPGIKTKQEPIMQPIKHR